MNTTEAAIYTLDVKIEILEKLIESNQYYLELSWAIIAGVIAIISLIGFLAVKLMLKYLINVETRALIDEAEKKWSKTNKDNREQLEKEISLQRERFEIEINKLIDNISYLETRVEELEGLDLSTKMDELDALETRVEELESSN
ncbi:hypothetical protein Ami103574_10705 [Aminipila butyrica]|uniref:Uncharacterized protein n=1 Tax=Aminipila butyrica TaxID=433296 RepID=A0A858BWG5_9FIRM|nr:hypothetical protein [Aminipila butyrica]QIB69762.1 hypothetical protein Ami103574_10705 [Aminipila butyrica]